MRMSTYMSTEKYINFVVPKAQLLLLFVNGQRLLNDRRRKNIFDSMVK